MNEGRQGGKIKRSEFNEEEGKKKTWRANRLRTTKA